MDDSLTAFAISLGCKDERALIGSVVKPILLFTIR
jgi:hypothetical protein